MEVEDSPLLHLAILNEANWSRNKKSAASSMTMMRSINDRRHPRGPGILPRKNRSTMRKEKTTSSSLPCRINSISSKRAPRNTPASTPDRAHSVLLSVN